jgi:DNA-binding transcriptional regulator YdaS (Cro superfamily)
MNNLHLTPQPSFEALIKVIEALGSQLRLAQALNVTQPSISYWLHHGVPPERLNDVLKACDHIVTKHDLRPDLFDRDIGRL